MSTKPRKYQICMNKGRKVNTHGMKRPKYSLKKFSSLTNSNGKSVIINERQKFSVNFSAMQWVNEGNIVISAI
jgi:hypothetical protein